jgi:hypothetical protein
MYSDWAWFLWPLAFIWLGILTFLIWKGKEGSDNSKKILNSVFEDSGEVKIDQLVRKINGLGSQVDDLKEKLVSLGEDGLLHVQRVELMRYNPYDDTGGDQSFTIVFLDKNGNGVVVTSLHSRSGTRIFAKPVIMGHPEKYEFSKEEEQVVKKAMKRE